MKTAFAFLLTFHGAVHLLGVVKAIAPQAVSHLKAPVSPAAAALWAVACLSLWASAVVLYAAPRQFWMVALPALFLSQSAIFLAWADARWGTALNVIVALPVALALLQLRPGSFASAYRREVEAHLVPRKMHPTVEELDLEALPELVQRYLRRSGVVERAHVRNVQMRFHGEMRIGHDGAWVPVEGEQFDSFEHDARIFLVRATMKGLPFEALHVYSRGTATMRVRVASLIDVVDARGPLMNQSETVTLFNDMCWLAPGSLLDARITWQTVDERTVRAAFVNLGLAIHADLTFDEAGDLVGFVSNDRYQSADGKTFLKYPWSTPLREYRRFGAARIASAGEALWKEPSGDFPYARFAIDEIVYDLGPAAVQPASGSNAWLGAAHPSGMEN